LGFRFDKVVKASEGRKVALCNARAGEKAGMCKLNISNLTGLHLHLLTKRAE
jgi:hypothetical protein